MAAFAVVFAYVVTFVVGIPTYLLLAKNGSANFKSMALFGGAVGLLVGGFLQEPTLAIMGASAGAVVAIIFASLANAPDTSND